ncbi:citrate synthase-lysine N-methyltransferase CSKMT, mitochondrial isoform X1 [Hypomesus transpacificus]|uniref:citrate synthase-lysine N-methyltransferase CSKMT, mitochondrial isoform X1 n=2 Tax=Hypomesus transpacificus TaxID=137520 RepID=UPI001F084C74|nr:citrate synthase-lysine N-methyltransferase CSKMT, mitochondrial isoform X1 [Hypomesus transpacificus]
MAPLMSNVLLMSYKRLGKLVSVISRNHSSLTTELIENMDKKATWDRFYTENRGRTPNFKNFEWFFGFGTVQDFILPLLHSKPDSNTIFQVLDLGCGTSALGLDIYKNSFSAVQVTCADISPVAVRFMQEQIRTKAAEPRNPDSRLEFLELDCTELHQHYGSESLDLIIDKGTTDALLRSREGRGKADQVLQQSLRVLRSSGLYLQFSDEDPDARLLWLETVGQDLGGMTADVCVQEVGDLRGICYFCYQIRPRHAA